MQIKEFTGRHSLVIGLVLMFLFTWPIDLANSGLMPFQVPFVIYIFLGWGFVIASLIMTGFTQGKEGVIDIFKAFLRWRVDWKWYLVAICLYPALWIGGVYLNSALARTPVDFSTVLAYQLFGESAKMSLFIIPWFLFEFVTNGEEMGWRGYVLPRLQTRYSARTAALFTGLIWGFWHLPKHLPGINLFAFTGFMVHSLAYSVVLTWLYNSTERSLLMVTICHAAINTAGMFLPVANALSSENMGAFITFVFLEVVTAIVVTVAAGPGLFTQAEAFRIKRINLA